MLSEQQKTLKFPEFDDFHSTRDYVLAIKKFRKALVAEIKKLYPDYYTLNVLPRGGETGTFFMRGYNKGFNHAKQKLLVLLGVKEKKEEHSSLCRVMHNLHPESWEKKEKQKP